MITAGEDLHINVTDVEALQRKQTLTGHGDWITCLSVAPNLKTFITGSLDKTIKVWDFATNKCVKTIAMNAPVWGANFAPTGDYICAATEDGIVSLLSFVL